ncbi:MAG: ABC transporter ATP-binding protein [Chromatiales bacterium]|jgi:general nucleoside transport system ATP-binding protein|nr:ABC transporter ATP-binding protein [Chromatiales bacterium]
MSPPMSANDAPARLQLRQIRKTFPGVVANDGIDLTVRPGEIHALLGENGAGKSTLVKIVDGLLQADSGEMFWDGQPVTISGPKAARALGIGMVFQHFSLFEAMSVAENIALGLDHAIPMRHLSEKVGQLAQAYGLAIEPARAVHTLSVGERQRVEILRCLLEDAQLLIMDEPTSVLTPQEADRLFETLRRLAHEGRSILYISHKLHEIQVLCDTATILRGGRVAGACDPREETPESMARMMVGADLAEPKRGASEHGEIVLEISDLSLRSSERFGTDLHDINLSLRAGEILGIAGVAGNGQNELVKALSGERLVNQKDTIVVDGQAVGHLGPAPRRNLGLACIPEDRLGQGAVPSMSLVDNALLTASRAQAVTRGGFIRRGRLGAIATDVVAGSDVRCPGVSTLAQSLSGGNLQKYITGRELGKRPRVLIAAQPTWGVDAGAAGAIHQALLELADEGAAVLIISQELDELMTLCERIAVIAEGRLDEAEPTAALTPELIGMRMAGATSEAGGRGPAREGRDGGA